MACTTASMLMLGPGFYVGIIMLDFHPAAHSGLTEKPLLYQDLRKAWQHCIVQVVDELPICFALCKSWSWCSWLRTFHLLLRCTVYYALC